jgi:hypothetical protein
MSTEKKGRGPNAHNRSKIEMGKKVAFPLVLEVFEYWKLTMGKKRAQLDIKRERDLRWAIAAYSVEGCKEAIAGCALSDFHMGKNKQKTSYNDISVIFRDASQIEKFQELYDAGNTSAKSNWASE